MERRRTSRRRRPLSPQGWHPFVSRHETAECGLRARRRASFSRLRPASVCQDARASRFVYTQPQPAPRQQVVINSRRNNRLATAEGTTRTANREQQRGGGGCCEHFAAKTSVVSGKRLPVIPCRSPRPTPKAVQTRESLVSNAANAICFHASRQ